MMGDFAIYAIKSAVILTLLFSVYKLTAGRLKCASLRRALLLSIYALSLGVPGVTRVLPVILSHFRDAGNEIVVTGVVSVSKSYFAYTHLIDAGLAVMVAGSVAVTLMTFVGILWIARCRLRGKSVKIGNIDATIVSDPAITPFSFGRRIFLSETDYTHRNEMIIAHEASHIAHRHWIDLIVGRVVVILQWWNPLAWLMLRELQGVHEFQTDGDVIAEGYDRKEYQYLLIQKTVGSRFQLITDSFNHTTLKSRIRMINRADSPMSRRLWSLLCIPALVGGVMILSSQTFADSIFPLTNSFRVLASSSRNPDIPSGERRESIAKEDYTPHIRVNGKAIHRDAEPDITVDGKTVDKDYLDRLDPRRIAKIEVFKDMADHPNGFISITLKP